MTLSDELEGKELGVWTFMAHGFRLLLTLRSLG